MEDRKRTLLAIVISCIILLAIGYGFGMSIFASTAEIILADTSVSAGISGGGTDSSGDGAILVGVTPDTVQSVIADMTRYRSYSRTLSVQYTWDGGTGGITAQVMVDDGWSRCDATLSSGIVERSIVGDGTLWYWYDNGEQYLTADAGSETEDLVQYLPTYENILALDPTDILDAGYEEKNGDPAIYVEAEGSLEGYVERYWVSVQSGLLTAAETEKNGVVVYTMSSGSAVSPLSEAENAFTLPDGTVLHSVQT